MSWCSPCFRKLSWDKYPCRFPGPFLGVSVTLILPEREGETSKTLHGRWGNRQSRHLLSSSCPSQAAFDVPPPPCKYSWKTLPWISDNQNAGARHPSQSAGGFEAHGRTCFQLLGVRSTAQAEMSMINCFPSYWVWRPVLRGEI